MSEDRPEMIHRAASLFLVVLAGCSSRSPKGERSAASASSSLAPAPMPSARGAPEVAARRGPHLVDTPLEAAFWTSTGTLVLASGDAFWKLGPTCATPERAPAGPGTPTSLVADSGVDRFVVERASGFELWDAATLRRLGSIDHSAHGRGGTISPDGKRVALGGCVEIAEHRDLATSCGELYDEAGAHAAGFVAKHAFDTLSFSGGAKYLTARAMDRGLTVFDGETGRSIVSRPNWARIQEVHGWNRPDVAEIFDDELVVAHGDTVEHVDLASGKVLGKLVTPGKTLAVYGAKSKRVVVLQGAMNRARVWDVKSHTIVRTFELGKQLGRGANCSHCALEIDEVDEDRVWLTSAYTNDRLSLAIGTGAISQIEEHVVRSDSVPSKTHRVEQRFHPKRGGERCLLVRRDGEGSSTTLPTEYCSRSPFVADVAWPYPGFDPSGRWLASLKDGRVAIWEVEGAQTICVAGAQATSR